MAVPLATLAQDVTAQSLRLVVQKELRSPNAWLWRHWRVKQRETREWEREIWVAIMTRCEARSFAGVLAVSAGLKRRYAAHERRRVTLTRIVPSKRNFIRDDDNLKFAGKPLLDALKRLGLIYDDSRKWLEHDTPSQVVGTYRHWATVIQIEVLGG